MADDKGRSYTPLGVSGLPRYAGYVFDEWLTELQGPRGRRVLREMADNSPIIGGLKFAIEMMIRQAPWVMTPYDESDQSKQDADFIDQCLHDMETSFEDTLADILTMCDYGWSLFETPYKKRDGKASKFNDGKIGWLGWQMRGQESLLRWEYKDNFAMLPSAFVQLGPPDFQEHTIPMDRCLLFRTTTRRGNPEGRSLWRNAYTSWYMAKHLEAVEAIGAERDMAGLPVGKVPSNILDPSTPEEAATGNAWRDLVTNIRRDQQEGVLIPSDRDEQGNPEWELTLLSTGGQRQFNLGDVIARHEQRMLVTCLGDFILLGSSDSGAQTLGKTKIELFATSISALLDQITAIINDQAIPRLMKLNGRSGDKLPKIAHGDVERMDLDTLGNFLYQLGQAGFTLDTDPQGELMTHLMNQAHLPQAPDDLEEKQPEPLVLPGAGAVPAAPSMPGQSVAKAQPNRQRGSMKVPNVPTAPKAKVPDIAKSAPAAKGALAKSAKASRRMSEEVFAVARQFSEDGAGLEAVAFDLDSTANAHPDQLVPLAHYLKNQSVKIGVMTGNQSPTVRQAWDGLGYPEPDFFLVSKPDNSAKDTARWKAKQCIKLGVNILIDDFQGGAGTKTFEKTMRKLGGDTLALDVPE